MSTGFFFVAHISEVSFLHLEITTPVDSPAGLRMITNPYGWWALLNDR